MNIAMVFVLSLVLLVVISAIHKFTRHILYIALVNVLLFISWLLLKGVRLMFKLQPKESN